MPLSSIPAVAVYVTCPKCRERFIFSPPCPPDPGLSGNPDGPPPSDPPGSARPQASSAAPFPPRPSQPRTLAFSFQGTGGEYFGIWIVNALLKIVTCGVYSAWAKVRKRSYLYGSTTLQGEPFAYLADPLTIFKGWLIGAAAFLLYMIGQQVSVVLSVVIALAVFAAVPWLVVRSRMFNARNSSHRNIRFAFTPNYREAYTVFLGLPVLAMFTLGLLTPYVQYRQKKFLIENSSYGATPFAFGATAEEFYRPYLRAALGALALLSCGLALFPLLAGGSLALSGMRKAGAAALALAPVFVLFPLLYFYLATYLRTALANLAWNATSIGQSRFTSTLRTWDMAWLYFSNAVAIACTLGLLIPWAAVRVARYRFQQLKVETREGLDGFLALARKEEVNATGEEIGDIFGVSVDLGF
jgi:uncharacterized membrane protein YjgN (DUF898 family)